MGFNSGFKGLIIIHTELRIIFPNVTSSDVNFGYSGKEMPYRFWETCSLHNFTIRIGAAGYYKTFFLPWRNSPLVGQGLLIIEGSWSHSDTPQSIVLLWTSDQPDAETSTWQHTLLPTDKHPCSRRDSNPQSQQANGHRDWPETSLLF